jgi:NADH-quinone oxidoreductase subunit I
MYGWGLIKGLGVTMRHFIESFTYDRTRNPLQFLSLKGRYNETWLEKHQQIDGKGIFTVQYPEQERQISENFRFLPMLVYEETPDNPRCTACGICARVCPPQCIWIQRGTDDRGRPQAKPGGFFIDTVICMSCGFCAEFCPFDAIKMNQDFRLVTTDRDRDMFYNLEKLLVPVEYYAKLHPTDYAREEAERQAKEEAKRQAAEARAAAKKAAEAPKPAPVAEAAPPAVPDDLKKIEGIGPKIAKVLQEGGITTFAQLGDTEPERIEEILKAADPNLLNLADPTTWPAQAKMAAKGRWDALEKYQERLKGGRES